jgi:aminoglycoside phosphotransferase (APT) family kinase protein
MQLQIFFLLPILGGAHAEILAAAHLQLRLRMPGQEKVATPLDPAGALPEPVLRFLRATGLAAGDEVPRAEALAGGVSSDIWRVHLRSGPVCVKRALARLRVAQRWEAPVERNRYERLWLKAANAILPGVAPRVLAGDDGGCFAMEDLGALPLWKAELRAGRADAAFAADVGRKLCAIHNATARRADIAAAFATDASFHALRLEPYLLAAARANAGLAPQLEKLSNTTAKNKLALVHGDVSPKNILVGPQGPVFLDAECAWYGDPAFDLAFCLNHLLLKGIWVPELKSRFLECFDALSAAYLSGTDWEPASVLEQRAARLLPGLLLARVDGKSPVEYLQAEAQKRLVREFASRHLQSPPRSLVEIGRAWQRS